MVSRASAGETIGIQNHLLKSVRVATADLMSNEKLGDSRCVGFVSLRPFVPTLLVTFAESLESGVKPIHSKFRHNPLISNGLYVNHTESADSPRFT